MVDARPGVAQRGSLPPASTPLPCGHDLQQKRPKNGAFVLEIDR